MNTLFRVASGETKAPSYIRELCLTLAHRWEPDRNFMLFSGFIDESDTHGPRPHVIMSAFLGTRRQWELFNRGLNRLRRDLRFDIFHATDFKGQTGEFAGWPESKCMTLVNSLVGLVRDELTEGIVTSLPYELYNDEFLAKLPRKMHRTSQYGICFLAMLESCLRHANPKRGTRNPLALVVEDGHKNSGDAKRVFEERRERYRRMGADALRTLTFASKRDSPELMAADFLAHSSAMGYRNKTISRPTAADGTPQPATGESGLTYQEVTPAYLRALIDEFEADKKAKADAYAARKAAWLKSLESSS